ncbi:MAG: WYL domain-containing protein [Lachnospiraceae bacterium]|nr:WYL domain-containing protein [Lachnospiraceae bacterium]
MNIFSEVYNCYYQILKSIIINHPEITLDDLRSYVSDNGFEESLLYLIPKIESGEWNLFSKNGNVFISNISKDFYVPLTTLQKSYIKTLLKDQRMALFLSSDERDRLNGILDNVEPLWDDDTFYYFDRFGLSDPYDDPTYIHNFQTILKAINNNQYVTVEYISPKSERIKNNDYLPCKLEYSIKNDCFRLLCINRNSVVTLNVQRMKSVTLSSKVASARPDIDKLITQSYYKEPVHLLISTKRNTLERAMLHFANYKKNTTKLDDNTYECFIYYNEGMELELP